MTSFPNPPAPRRAPISLPVTTITAWTVIGASFLFALFILLSPTGSFVHTPGAQHVPAPPSSGHIAQLAR